MDPPSIGLGRNWLIFHFAYIPLRKRPALRIRGWCLNRNRVITHVIILVLKANKTIVKTVIYDWYRNETKNMRMNSVIIFWTKMSRPGSWVHVILPPPMVSVEACL
jgi:hypothetical protein